ncbi:MAG TPA: YaiI/YqxD family protein [Desulfobacterales bacterium]|nr:YaiI/YqxD family protein [Desulfobacterales bacterium]
MKVWVDADACPVVIKEILFKAAERTGVQTILVANQPMPIPAAPCITFIKVGAGADVADQEIVKRLDAGDLVITADIPLAADVINKGGHALNPRGELYTTDNIGSRLSMRDFMDNLRADGVDTGGPPALNKGDRQAFANQLDTFLCGHGSKSVRRKPSPPPW